LVSKLIYLKVLHWKPTKFEEECDSADISELDALASDIRAELCMAKEEEERLTECIVDGLKKTERTLGLFFTFKLRRIPKTLILSGDLVQIFRLGSRKNQS